MPTRTAYGLSYAPIRTTYRLSHAPTRTAYGLTYAPTRIAYGPQYSYSAYPTPTTANTTAIAPRLRPNRGLQLAL
eukprot:2307907-Rhodomonas_salina.1